MFKGLKIDNLIKYKFNSGHLSNRIFIKIQLTLHRIIIISLVHGELLTLIHQLRVEVFLILVLGGLLLIGAHS